MGVRGDPDGATDVLAAAALLCRQTESCELGLCSAPITFPLLCPAILSSLLMASVLLFSLCSALLRSF